MTRDKVPMPTARANVRKHVLLSLKPRYVEKIFSGEKCFEFRRTKVKVDAGDWIFVYASSPDRQLVGRFRVGEVLVDTPSKLWSYVKDGAGISLKEFHEYFAGKKLAVGIVVKKPVRFRKSPSLQSLRKELGTFEPPQSYRYLTLNEAKELIALTS